MPSTETATATAARRLETACLCCGRRFNGVRVIRSELSHLCEPCYDEAGDLNAHNDGHHDGTASESCCVCQDTDPHGTFRTREVTGNQGKCLTDTDGRKKENAPTVPADAERVQLTGMRLGRPSVKDAAGLQGSVIKRSTHTTAGHSVWALVQVDGITQRRWFWAEDLEAVAPVRPARRSRRAA